MTHFKSFFSSQSPKSWAFLNSSTTATAAALLIVVLGAGALYLSQFSFLKNWGFAEPVVIILAALQVAYGAVIFRLELRNNVYMATLISALLTALALVGLIHNSGMLHSLLIAAWILMVFGIGMLGTNLLILSCLMTTAYYFVIYTGQAGQAVQTDSVAIAVVLVTYVATVTSYLVWRTQYSTGSSTGLKQMSSDGKNSHAQGELLIQSITDGVVVTDQSGKITLFNPAAAKMTSWAVEEALGIDAELVIKLQEENGTSLEDKEYPLKQVLLTQQAVNGIYRIVNKESQPSIVSVAITPMVDNKKRLLGTATILRDVSAARAEENRRAEFISTASHEMRTPVAAIEGYIQLALNEKVSKIDNKAKEFLLKGLESTHHLGKLFQDLLTSAKAEDGRIVSHPEAVEMGEFLQNLTDSLRFTAEKKGLLVDFRVGISSKEKAGFVGSSKVIKPLYYIYADPERLQEVITNLFDNAVKYTEKGKISIAITGDENVVQLYIQDTGAGIPAEDIPHLFQKFYRVDNSATRTVGGTGLGLFICKKIIELYKGTIWVSSKQGEGSTFFINMPRLSAAKAAELIKQKEQSLI